MAVRIESKAEPLPGYRLIERLGGGGFGEVWKAEAPGGLFKAIKFVFGDLKAAGDASQRAEQELKALSRVKTVRHPYVLSLERYDIIDGQLMIVMELADKNLWDRFKECRAQGMPGIPREELLLYLTETSEALDMMNSEFQLQHLDIKPQNLFLVHNHVKVADFGLVKDLEGMQASVTGGVTPVYAAPETFDGIVSRFCDQYSLAICYQELLTGQRPFNGNNVRQLILQHLQGVPNLSSLPPGDQPIMARALGKVPDSRFPTCKQFAASLRAATGQRPPVGAANGPAGNGQSPPALADLRTSFLDRQFDTGPQTQSTPTASLRARPQDPTPGTTPFLKSLEGAVLEARARKAPSEIKGEGCLFPSLVVGVGQLGLSILHRLRENLHERFGTLATLPQLRMLLLDTDPEVMRLATRSRAGTALSATDVLLTPLNRPSHYLKPREGRPNLEEWLNPRMLYRIPRSQVTTGVRALGRLAFCDHYRTIVRRLHTELDACLDPTALQSAARQSRLGIRSNRPRIYVLAGLGGGTGGGMFLDLAYTLRALLRQMGYEQPDVVGILLLPPSDTSRTRLMTQGNAHAALTELAYYGRPDTLFHARYHERETPIQDAEPPFSRCVLLPLPEETDEVATRELVELAGQYLERDLCSPLGRAIDLCRAGMTAPRWEERGLYYQTFGLYRLAWPRRAAQQTAARKLCQRLVTRWMSKDSKPIRESVRTWAQEQWLNLGLGADNFLGKLREGTQRELGQAPEALFRQALDALSRSCARIEAEPVVRGKPALELNPEEVTAALTQLEELVGKPTDEGCGETPGTAILAARRAVGKLAEEWGQKLAELPVHLIEEPEFRLAGAEEAIHQLVATVEQVLQNHEPLARDLTTRAAEAYNRVQAWLQPRPGMRRVPVAPGVILEALRNYPKWRLQSLMLQQMSASFLSMRGHLSDELREVNFCRVRLAELLKALQTPDPTTVSGSRHGLSIQLFPGGSRDLNEAVERFLGGLSPEAVLDLDVRLQEMIQQQFRALVHVCLTNTNILKTVELALVKTAEAFVTEHLSEMSVADMFFEQQSDPERAVGEIAGFFGEAAPELAPGFESAAPEEMCLLATPPGPNGERFQELAKEALPETNWNTAVSPDDILIYRELSHLPFSGLEQVGPAGQDAYRQMNATENFTPHTRTDVQFTR